MNAKKELKNFELFLENEMKDYSFEFCGENIYKITFEWVGMTEVMFTENVIEFVDMENMKYHSYIQFKSRGELISFMLNLKKFKFFRN